MERAQNEGVLVWELIAPGSEYRERNEIVMPPECVLKKWRHERGVVERRMETTSRNKAKRTDYHICEVFKEHAAPGQYGRCKKRRKRFRMSVEAQLSSSETSGELSSDSVAKTTLLQTSYCKGIWQAC